MRNGLALRLLVWYGFLRRTALALPSPANSYILEEFRVRLDSFKDDCETIISMELRQVEHDILRQQQLSEEDYSDEENFLEAEDLSSLANLQEDLKIEVTSDQQSIENVAIEAEQDHVLEEFDSVAIEEEDEELLPGEVSLPVQDSIPCVDEIAASETGDRLVTVDEIDDEKTFIVGDTDEEEDIVVSRVSTSAPTSSNKSEPTADSTFLGAHVAINRSEAHTRSDDLRAHASTGQAMLQEEEPTMETPTLLKSKAKIDELPNATNLESNEPKKKRKKKKKKRRPSVSHTKIPATVPSEIQIDKHQDDASLISEEPSNTFGIVISSILQAVVKAIAFTIGLAMIIVAASVMIKLTLEIIEESVKKKN